jgi:hypothetical protein
MEGPAVRLVSFDPAALTDPKAVAWWKKWAGRSDDATTRVLTAWQAWLDADPRPARFEYAWEEKVWKDVKTWLLEHVFNDKCAYCESPLELDRYHGDAEHFRPKGSVTIASEGGPRQKAKCTFDGKEIDHPGYFWLAYHWRNLMPACSVCNSTGKSDQFPAAKPHAAPRVLTAGERAACTEPTREFPAGSGMHFPGPQTLDALEDPLLLNPLTTDPDRAPAKHLRYGVGGTVVALDGSPLGTHSIKVYQLDRDTLQRRRHMAQENIRRRYYIKLLEAEPAQVEAVITSTLQPFLDGTEDYASAALQYLQAAQDAAAQTLARL